MGKQSESRVSVGLGCTEASLSWLIAACSYHSFQCHGCWKSAMLGIFTPQKNMGLGGRYYKLKISLSLSLSISVSHFKISWLNSYQHIRAVWDEGVSQGRALKNHSRAMEMFYKLFPGMVMWVHTTVKL